MLLDPGLPGSVQPGVLPVNTLQWKAIAASTPPILAGIRSMRRSGYRIVCVHGQLSGPLSWVFTNFNQDRSFCELLDQARGLGITSPNPLFELSGITVEHELLVLARATGTRVGAEGVLVSPAIPASFNSASPIDRLGRDFLDRHFTRLAQAAAAKRKVLRYIARISSAGKLSCGLESISKNSPIAQACPGDRVIEVHSDSRLCTSTIFTEPRPSTMGATRRLPA